MSEPQARPCPSSDRKDHRIWSCYSAWIVFPCIGVDDFAEEHETILRANCDEIGAGLRIIVGWQAQGWRRGRGSLGTANHRSDHAAAAAGMADWESVFCHAGSAVSVLCQRLISAY